MYQTVYHEAEIPVEEYIKSYVDVAAFLEACKDCGHYGRVWSCPRHSFDVMEYWKQFRTLKLCALEIRFDPELVAEVETEDELKMVLEEILPGEKRRLTRRMMGEERKHPGSVCLSAGGNCKICREGCSRPLGLPCRHPELMRYALESLGGNVCRTVEEILKVPMEWADLGRLPNHLELVSGLLLR